MNNNMQDANSVPNNESDNSGAVNSKPSKDPKKQEKSGANNNKNMNDHKKEQGTPQETVQDAKQGREQDAKQDTEESAEQSTMDYKLKKIFESSDYTPHLNVDSSMEKNIENDLIKAREETQDALEALQRERASFINYKKRSANELLKAKEIGMRYFIESLLPALDDIERAGQELMGPMQKIAEKIKAVFAKFSVQSFGEIGEEFDPAIHEALLNNEVSGIKKPEIAEVVERGYMINSNLIRPAKVVVRSPKE
jgi:molecular chaperone GrpE